MFTKLLIRVSPSNVHVPVRASTLSTWPLSGAFIVTDMSPDGGITMNKSQLFRAFGTPTAAPVFAIWAIALLAYTGQPVQCQNAWPSKLAHSLCRCPGLL